MHAMIMLAMMLQMQCMLCLCVMQMLMYEESVHVYGESATLRLWLLLTVLFYS